MPRGTAHDLVGLLLRNGRSLILRTDDGGEWRLDAPSGAGKLVGRRVRVTGTRDGFDLLAVRSFEAVDGHIGGHKSAARVPSVRASVIRRCTSALFPNRSPR